MSRSATNVWTLQHMRREFISVEKRLSWTHVAVALRSVSDCDVWQVLDDSHNDMLGEPIETYETYVKMA